MASVSAAKRRGRYSSSDPANLPPDLFHQVLDTVYKSKENSWKAEHGGYGAHGTNFTAALVSKRWHRASMRALTVARVTSEFKKEADLLKQLTCFKALTKTEVNEKAVDSLSEKFLRAAKKNWPGLRTLVLHNIHTSFHGPEAAGAYLSSLTSVVISDSGELFRSVYDPLTSWLSSVENLTNLEFLNTYIERLPKDFVSRFPKLKRLRLSNVRWLSRLPESMGDLVGLRELVLDDCNDLPALPRTFSRLSGLRRLRWESRNIGDVSVIANLKGLRHLRLDTCSEEYEAITGTRYQNTSSRTLQGLIHCTGLRVLELHGCEGLLGDLGWLAQLTALRKFEVCSDQVPGLPANIGALKRLERFRLEKGHFKTLPSSFGNLKALQHLSIESFALEELPNNLSSLTQLTNLSLSASEDFNVASMNFGSITSLQTSSISDCSLPGIPEDLGFLPNLTKLHIDCVPFNSILPRGFPSLQELNISGSSFADVPGLVARSEVAQLTAEDYPCLRVLKITRWKAESLPHALGQLQHLEHLELTDGDFMRLPDTLSSLCSLKTLLLQRCRNLVYVPPTLGSMSSLTKLWLDTCDKFDNHSLTGRLKEVKRP